MNYLLLSVAAFLFSTQFIFLKFYQKLRGISFYTSCIFVFLSSIFLFLATFIIGGFKIEFSFFTLLVALIYSIIFFLSTIFGIKSLSKVNLSVYSMFLMSGGMLLPFLYGITKGNEITALKVAGVLFIFLSILMSLSKDKKTAKIGYLYCIAIFILNGLIGIIQTFFSNHSKAISIVNFMSYYSFCSVVITLIAMFLLKIMGQKINIVVTKRENILSLLMPFCLTVVNGIATFIMLNINKLIDPTVQYPIITGGCIFFAIILGLFFKEKITIKIITRAIMVLVGTFFIII